MMKQSNIMKIGLMLLLFPAVCQAIYIDAVTFDLPSDRDYISKEVRNNNDSKRLYTISAVAIDRPGNNETRSRIKGGEILFTPLKFVLGAGESNFFKLFYRGPKDDKERYYRVMFNEDPLQVFTVEKTAQLQLIQTIALETIFVVRPRKLKFDYVYDEKKGTLKNTGNTYFKAIIHKGCDGSEDEGFQSYLLPGETLKQPGLKGKNRKFIMVSNRYERLGSQCFN